MTKLENLFLIYMYDNGRTIYLIMGGLGEWRSSGGGTSEEPKGPPNTRYVVAINENRPDGRPRHQDKGFTPPPLGVVHHVLCKANCRGVKDVEATRGALPVT